jgi:2-aminoadipate transaminase
VPRHPGGVPGRPARPDCPDRQARYQHLHLAQRAHTLCTALQQELPDARFVAPQGGYFLWLELPRGTDVNALFKAAAERGVQFVKGSDFVLEGAESSLRLAYSGVTTDQIEEGVRRLAEAYSEVSAGVASAA